MELTFIKEFNHAIICIIDSQFNIYAISDGSVTGKFKVRWMWE